MAQIDPFDCDDTMEEVHRSGDGVAVVCHERTTGDGYLVDRFVWERHDPNTISFTVSDVRSQSLTDANVVTELTAYSFEGYGSFTVTGTGAFLQLDRFTEDEARQLLALIGNGIEAFESLQVNHLIELNGGGDSLY